MTMNKKGEAIRSLRLKGKTYNEISDILKLPKSTVAWWLREFKLPESVRKKILNRAKEKWRKNMVRFNSINAKIRSEKAAKIREEYKEKGIKQIKGISTKELKLIGSALYWAEGSNHRNSFRFANSDPMMIVVMMKFMREICKIPNEKIKARIHLYPQIDENQAITYWKRVTGLPKCNFQKSQLQVSKASRGKRSNCKLPNGTLHLTVCNTKIVCLAKGWIKGIHDKICAGIV
jgi:transcriptional regulator with XRE-family HTH domain